MAVRPSRDMSRLELNSGAWVSLPRLDQNLGSRVAREGSGVAGVEGMEAGEAVGVSGAAGGGRRDSSRVSTRRCAGLRPSSIIAACRSSSSGTSWKPPDAKPSGGSTAMRSPGRVLAEVTSTGRGEPGGEGARGGSRRTEVG